MASVTALAEPIPPAGSPVTPASATRHHRFDLAAVFTAAAALGGWRLGLRPLSDNSFFVHLVTGRFIVAHGVPHADPYSFTANGHAWIAQSWLMEWTYGRLDAAFGGFGIRVLIAVIGALLLGGMYRLALHTSGSRRRAALVMLVAFGPVVVLFDERPLSLGLLALLGVVWCVELPDSWIARHAVIALPVLMWVWGNSHGSFALGYVYLGLHLVARLLDGAPPWRAGRERSVLIGALAGAVALCVNPYGPSLLWFPVMLVRKGDVLRNISEWKSPDFHSTGTLPFALFLVTTILALALGKPSRRRDVLVCVPFLFLALWALRNIGIATIVALPVLSRAVGAVGATDPAPVAAVPDPPPAVATSASPAKDPQARAAHDSRIAAVLVAAMVMLGIVFTMSAKQTADFDGTLYSARALRAVEHQGLIGRRLLTTDANAGYVLLKEWPRQHIFMDDRYDMFPRKIVFDYLDLAHGAPDWRRILDRYRVDVVIWPAERPLTSLLADDTAWHRIYRDHDWVVFRR